MKKSILTVTLVAVFALGFSDSEASWVFGKNNKQTASEFLAAFGPAESEFEGVFDASKHLGTAINHPSKAGKPLKNFVKKLIDALDAFKVKLAPNKLNGAVSEVGVASQSVVSDPTIGQNKAVLLSTLGGIEKRLSPLREEAIKVKKVQNGTVTALVTLLQHIGNLRNMLNSVQSPAYGVQNPTQNAPQQSYNPYQAPAPAPAPAAAPAPRRGGR